MLYQTGEGCGCGSRSFFVGGEEDVTNEEMAKEIQNGNTALTFDLWARVKPYAHSRAWQYYQKIPAAHRMDLEDLDQASYLAFTDALELYQPARGMGFIGYFEYHLKKAFGELAGFRKKDALLRAVSIDAPVKNEDGEDLSLLETLEDPAGREALETAEGKIYAGQLHEALESALAALAADHEEEAGLIRQHYFDGIDVSELAERAGTDVKTIHRKKRDGLMHLRCNRKSRKMLQEYIELATPWSWCSGVHVTEDIVIQRETIAARIIGGRAPL